MRGGRRWVLATLAAVTSAVLAVGAPAAAGTVSGAAVWQVVTGNIRWSCGGRVESWSTWQAQYVGGRATGATRDSQAHRDGKCPAEAEAGALPVVSLPMAPLRVSSGPVTGDLAAAGSGECAVAQAGRVVKVISGCNRIDWVPGSDWVVYDLITPPPVASVTGDYALHLGTAATPVAIPCLGGVPQQMEPLPGPAVAYTCNGVLDVLRLGAAHPQAKGSPWPNLAGGLVDPAQREVAVTSANGWVSIFHLADDTRATDIYRGGTPVTMAWSANGLLAIAAAGGVTVWDPGVGWSTATVATGEGLLTWLPDNSGVLAMPPTAATGGPARVTAYLVRPDGRAQSLTQSRSDPEFGFTSDGRDYWTEPGGAGAIGPYRLVAHAVSTVGAPL